MTNTNNHITLSVAKAVNYALQQNKIPVVRQVDLENNSTESLTDLTLHLHTEPAFCRPFDLHIEAIHPGESLRLKDLQFTADPEYLASLTERQNGILIAELRDRDGNALMHAEEPLPALSFDEWPGSSMYPELLAAYCLPNHPEVVRLTARAAELLGKWTGDPSLDGYQSGDPNRVLRQCAALYAALQEQNIVYSVPPASFERMGQRIRLCDAVIQQKLGTCLDLTAFYAAGLEAMGLHPVLLLGKGHIMTGVWLNDSMFPESVLDDISLVTKRMTDGINEMAAIETTALVAGSGSSFDDACASAARQLAQPGKFDLVIDIHRARVSGIRPLPLRIHTDKGWHIEKDPRPEVDLTAAPKPLGDTVEIGEGKNGKPSKMLQWERKLLDLDMRNTLLNLRTTKNVLPLLTPSLSEVEGELAKGTEFGIMACPAEWESEKDFRDPEAGADVSKVLPLLASEFANKRLRALANENDLRSQITSLNRAARLSLEENGANTLYLTLGLLRWQESGKNGPNRYAPLVLLPVDIVRKASNKGYVIRLRDEEPQMNNTLLEMLKQDHGITIEGLDPLPRKGDRVDLRTVFAVLRHAIMDHRGWDVIETAFLGIFSFTRFVMWNDMRRRAEDLMNNKIVRSLMEGKLTWEPMMLQPGGKIPENTVLIPLPADASQLCAIEMAAEGESFVLHGPPGTGKSQTITALIANALAQGKTVLFVAEKAAALDVVHKRLNEIGLGAFCLALHSNKARKKDVLDQLNAATEVTREMRPEDYQKRADETAALRAELDEYAAALHAPQTCGMDTYDLIGAYEAAAGFSDAVTLTRADIEQLTGDDLERMEVLIERLTAAARAIGHPAGHPLTAVTRTRYDHTIKSRLDAVLSAYAAAAEHLEQALTAFVRHTELPMPQTRAEVEGLLPITRELRLWTELPGQWIAAEDVAAEGQRVCAAAILRDQAAQRRAELLTTWNEAFLRQDGKALMAEWQEINAKWALPRALGMSGLRRKLAPFAVGAVPEEGLADHFLALEEYASAVRQAEAATAALGDAGHAMHSLPEHELRIRLEEARASADRLYELTGSDSFRQRCCGDIDTMLVGEALETFWQAFLTAEAEAADLLGLDTGYTTENWASGWQDLCKDIRANIDDLKEWMIWNSLAAEAEAAGLHAVVEAYRAGTDHDQILGSWHKALYRGLTELAIDESEVLGSFSGALFNEKLAQFKRLEARMMELARSEIYDRLAARVPDFTQEAAQSPELNILRRAIRSGGRGVSIRKLFDEIPDLLPRLCPCMLMSPLSAAQYLDTQRPPFDLVVFDEASQMPTCNAVGALARGKNAVIVGDPKQMPPTSFFMGSNVDEDALETEDLESILDDCLALNMPETHLQWHYRSRHESLIAFSNSQFYDNKLHTFPSPDDRQSQVTLEHIDGVFERGKGRQNRAEAEAIVAELQRRCHDPELSGRSVGVVTFNVNQQALIEDLLNAACQKDAALDQWAYRSAEPIFIKNLENVQGDERDVILFSVGYGPDESGKLYMNFGPLNRTGGWRRLNVAVTRARYEMKVYSTLRPADIDLGRSAAQGVAALRAFLEYAEGRPLAQTPAQMARSKTYADRDGVAQAICDALAEHGYSTACNVGHSAYRVDVGVVDPRDPGRYLLGILLDGDSYGSAPTTYDRELGQIAVLEGLGWNLRRIWSMDWWDNRRKELERILAVLEELQKPAEEPEAEPDASEDPAPEEKPLPELPFVHAEDPHAQPYEMVSLSDYPVEAEQYLDASMDDLIRFRLLSTVGIEAPICQSLLLRRVHQSFGLTGNPKVRIRTLNLLESLGVPFTEESGQKVYWRQNEKPGLYENYRIPGCPESRREAREMPRTELINALCAVLERCGSLPYEGLLQETARVLGYTRAGEAMGECLSAALEYARSCGRIHAANNRFHLPDLW